MSLDRHELVSVTCVIRKVVTGVLSNKQLIYVRIFPDKSLNKRRLCQNRGEGID